MNVSNSGEFGLIERLHRELATRRGTRHGIGDDGAVLDALAHPIITTDALIENVHFRRDWTTARALGRKAMAVNLSDLAAMGARPVAAFVSLALPPDCELAWVQTLYAGMEEWAARHEFTIAGGDTTRAPLVMISLTLVGELMTEAAGRPVLRSGARVGDAVCVTGTLGDSAAGLTLLQNPRVCAGAEFAGAEFLVQRHLDPTPRLDAMRALLSAGGARRDAIHAALDLSDGLAGDAAHIARASGVDLDIEAGQLPISPPCRALAQVLNRSPLEWALSGGEDYELCVCVAPAMVEALRAASQVSLTPIGRVVEGTGQVRVWENGRARAKSAAWTHF